MLNIERFRKLEAKRTLALPTRTDWTGLLPLTAEIDKRTLFYNNVSQ